MLRISALPIPSVPRVPRDSLHWWRTGGGKAHKRKYIHVYCIYIILITFQISQSLSCLTSHPSYQRHGFVSNTSMLVLKSHWTNYLTLHQTRAPALDTSTIGVVGNLSLIAHQNQQIDITHAVTVPVGMLSRRSFNPFYDFSIILTKCL